MALILILGAVVTVALIVGALRFGFERTLPLAAFLLVIFPNECQINLSGLFDLTTQRLIVIILLTLYLGAGRRKQRHGTRALPLKYLLICYVVWLLISTANSIVFSISLKTVLSQIFDFYLPYYIFAKSISRVETVHRIIWAFMLAVCACCVFGAVEAYKGWSILSLFPTLHGRFASLTRVVLERGLRVQSTFAHPILFGAALSLAIPQTLYLLAVAKTKPQKALCWIGLLLMFVNIYKTTSRGPWLALLLSLLLLVLFSQWRVKKYVVWIVLLSVVTLIVRPGVWESIKNLYVATGDPDSPQGVSYEWRYALYRIGFQHLNADLSRGLWGYGPESFYYLGWRGEFLGDMVTYDTCDSSIAAVMIETGYIGLFLVLAIFVTAGAKIFVVARRMSAPAKHLAIILFINISAFLFLMTNVALFGWGQQSYMLWTIFALSMVYPRLIQVESRERKEAATVGFGKVVGVSTLS